MYLLAGSEWRLRRRLRLASSAWRRLVHRVADTNRRLSRSERERYAAVHERLLKVCDEWAREEACPTPSREVVPHQGRKGGRTQMIHQLHALLQPWGQSRSIHDAPQAIVDDLLAQQRSLEERITGTSARPSAWWMQPVVFVAVAGITAGVAFTLLFDSADASLLLALRSWLYSAVNRIAQATMADKLLIGGIFAWLCGTIILWTAFRR